MRLHFIEGGEIVNVHGLKGEIKVLPWVDSPEDLVEFDRCRIARRDYEIELARVQKTCALIKLKGVSMVLSRMHRSSAARPCSCSGRTSIPRSSSPPS